MNKEQITLLTIATDALVELVNSFSKQEVLKEPVYNSVDEFVKAVQNELLVIVSGAAFDAETVGLFCATCSSLSSLLARSIGARLYEVYQKVYALQSQYSVSIVGVKYLQETNECFYIIKHNCETQEVKIM